MGSRFAAGLLGRDWQQARIGMAEEMRQPMRMFLTQMQLRGQPRRFGAQLGLELQGQAGWVGTGMAVHQRPAFVAEEPVQLVEVDTWHAFRCQFGAFVLGI